jgi:FAD/FMN-containing dehydrogenase
MSVFPTNPEVKQIWNGFEAFQAKFSGQLIFRNDPDYDTARAVWNGMIDRHPALIARPKTAADVSAAVNFARESGLVLAVRGGGHNVAGSAVCDDGLVIDLSQMRAITVDPTARRARAQGGVTWGELDAATQQYGLAAPGGVVSDTGIAGLTLGGGLGWLRRKHGLSSDNLVSVEIVTADGRILTASETENTDLFWGVRGGGGNFGVVTTFEYQLHPVGPEVFLAFVFYPVSIAKEALRFYREWAANAPDEISAFAILGTVPHNPTFPAEAQGSQYVTFLATYIGEVEDGEKALQPLRDFSKPIIDLSGRMPFVDVQRILDEDYPAGKMRYYWKSTYLTGLTDEAIDKLIISAYEIRSAHSTIDIWQLGGAMSRIAPDATAFATRSAPFLIGVEANWEHAEDDIANIAWTRDTLARLQSMSDGTQYLNFPGLMEGGEAAIQQTFGQNYERLAVLKAKYDPTNLFRLNSNIKPAG